MRKVLLSIMIGLAATAMASAATLCTDVPSGTSVLGGFSCELGGLTFSNFSAQVAAGSFTPNVTLTGASQAGSAVYLTFNPNMAPQTGQSLWDMYFYFQVTGGVLGIDLYNGGQGTTGTSIGETVCSGPFSGIQCTGSTLATLAANTGDPAQEAFFASTNPVYIWKDILVVEGSHMTGFQQSFHTPEPMTFVLIGTGLLGLGILGRRRASK